MEVAAGRQTLCAGNLFKEITGKNVLFGASFATFVEALQSALSGLLKQWSVMNGRIVMNRREVLGVVGASAIAVGAFSTAGAQEKKKSEVHKDKDGHADQCAKDCADCMVECSKCIRHCLEQLAAGKKEYAKCAEMCGDCRECCGTAAKCCHGPMAAAVCEACAKCCEACAAECEKFPSDEICAACAKACRACAKSCHAMMKH